MSNKLSQVKIRGISETLRFLAEKVSTVEISTKKSVGMHHMVLNVAKIPGWIVQRGSSLADDLQLT